MSEVLESVGKVLSKFFGFVATMAVACLLGLIISSSLLINGKSESLFTHAEIESINPVLIVDSYTLLDPQSYSGGERFFLNELIKRGVVVRSPFGLIPNEAGTLPEILNVIIQSGGGEVGAGLKLIRWLELIRGLGIRVDCYVGEAQSMAFTLMVLGCDRVVAKKRGVLMQHRTRYMNLGTTPVTYHLDNFLSRKEAKALGLDYGTWSNIVRGSDEDHIFTESEIKQYKLVDEWIE